MSYLLAQLIIFIIWIFKWMVIKTRLFIPAIYAVVIFIGFKDWYQEHTMLADGIGIGLIGLVAISWIITLILKIKEHRVQRQKDIDYAYRIAGKPIILRKIEK